MPCTKPNLAFQHKFVKQSLRFVGREHYRLDDGTDPYVSDEYKFYARHSEWRPLVLPCQQCDWCRLQNSREKAVRCVHEASMHENNCFLTLTYRDECLPPKGHLRYSDASDFVKRLRTRLCRDGGCEHNRSCRGLCPKIRTFGCAEYGENFGRPHFHILIFGYDFSDKKFWRYSQNDWSKDKWPVYRSEFLEEIWTDGFSEIGTVTFESAAYVARYVSKRITGKLKESHYGEFPPERSVCVSNRKGIGLAWLEAFHRECMSNDSVVLKGVEMRLPRYYSKKLETWFPERFALVKEKRLSKIKSIDLDSTFERLKTREKVFSLKLKKLVRGYENGS